jgi:hypothetical protein
MGAPHLNDNNNTFLDDGTGILKHSGGALLARFFKYLLNIQGGEHVSVFEQNKYTKDWFFILRTFFSFAKNCLL